MATLYPADDTSILRALLSNDEEAAYPVAPTGAGAPLVFDHTTNAALVADLRRSTDAYRLAVGVLTKSGVVVTPNPPDAVVIERAAATDDVRTTAAAAMTRLDAIIGGGGTFTAAQVRDAMVDLARIQRRELRLLRAQAG